MRPTHDTDTDAESTARDFSLERACLLCDGDLEVRVRPGGATTTFCPRCRWISHPHMRKGEGGIHVTHPAGLVG